MPRPIVNGGGTPPTIYEVTTTDGAWTEIPGIRLALDQGYVYTIAIEVQGGADSANTVHYIRSYKFAYGVGDANISRQGSTETHVNEEGETNPNFRDRADDTTNEIYFQVRGAVGFTYTFRISVGQPVKSAL